MQNKYYKKFIKCPKCRKKLSEAGLFVIDGEEVNLLEIKHKGFVCYTDRALVYCNDCKEFKAITTLGIDLEKDDIVIQKYDTNNNKLVTIQ